MLSDFKTALASDLGDVTIIDERLVIAANNAIALATSKHDWSQTLGLGYMMVTGEPGTCNVYASPALTGTTKTLHKLKKAWVKINDIYQPLNISTSEDYYLAKEEPGAMPGVAWAKHNVLLRDGTNVSLLADTVPSLVRFLGYSHQRYTTVEDSLFWDTNINFQRFFYFALLCELNLGFKTFVVRTEGTLPPPTDTRDSALNDLINYDVDQNQFNYESHYD